jgi:hypothetical protein
LALYDPPLAFHGWACAKQIMPKTEPPFKASSTRSLFALPRFQFSLWRLMVAVTVVAVLLFLVTKVGGFVEIVFASIVICIVPTPLVICAIYGRNDARAFSIGALIPWAAMVAFRIPAMPSSFFSVIWLFAMSGICGVIAVVTRRWVQPMDGQ